MAGFKAVFFILVIGFLACKDKPQDLTISKKSGANDIQVDSLNRIQVSVAVAKACQEPLTFEDGSGISLDIIKELNTLQDKYEFTHEFLPTKRLQSLAQEKKIHIAAFSNLSWGWDKNKVSRSSDLISDKDVFFTLKKEGRDRSFFESIESKSIVGVKGFHYNFKKSSFIGVQSEKSVVEMVLLERAEVGVVSIFTLQYLFLIDPEKYSKLLVSKKYDSEYDRYFVLMNDSPIQIEELNSLLKKMKAMGRFKSIFEKYGLTQDDIAEK